MKKTEITEKGLSKTEISNMPNKELEVMIIQILTRLERRVDELKTSTQREKM